MFMTGRSRLAAARGVWRDRSGLALIEFAYALPLLLTIGLAGTEAANLALVTLRINQLAMLAADNAARVRISMDEGDVNEVMVGMRFAGSGIKFGERGRVIVSDIEPNGLIGTNGGQKITWQRCFGAKNAVSAYGAQGTGATGPALRYGVAPAGPATTEEAGTTPVDNGALIVAEVRYTYVPLVASMFMGNRELRAVQTFPVRDRASQTLTNTSGLTDAAKRLCDAAHLSAD
jgi:hypothetical protein